MTHMNAKLTSRITVEYFDALMMDKIQRPVTKLEDFCQSRLVLPTLIP